MIIDNEAVEDPISM